MRVAIFLPFFTLGGAEKQGLYLAEHLSLRGDDVDVIAFDDDAGTHPLRSRIAAKGLRSHLLPLRIADIAGRGGMLRAAAALAAVLAQVRPSIVVPYTYYPNLVSAALSAAMSVPVLWNQRGEDDVARSSWEGLVDRQRGVFVANAAASGAWVAQRLGLAPQRVQLVRNAYRPPIVTADARTTTRRRLRLRDDDLAIVHVANFFPYKDHATSIAAFARLHAAHPRARLLLAGDDPGLTQQRALRALVQELGLAGAVRFLGTVGDVPALLAASDVGVLTSTGGEGCPNALLEYMGASLPVVSTDILAARDALPPDYPHLVGVRDAVALAQRLAALAAAPRECRVLGASLRSWVLCEYEPAAVLSMFSNVVDAAVAGARSLR